MRILWLLNICPPAAAEALGIDYSVREGGHGWEFLFLGANMDAVKEASRLGIAPERTASFINDSEGIEINFRCVSKAMKYFRACEELDESGWKSEIEHDQCRRG